MSKRPPPLSPADIEQALVDLPGWELAGDKLVRDYDFGDFSRAVACLCATAVVAAELDHHPNWSGGHSRLRFELSTNDPKGVTRLDLELARKVETLAQSLGAG